MRTLKQRRQGLTQKIRSLAKTLVTTMDQLSDTIVACDPGEEDDDLQEQAAALENARETVAALRNI